jgi:intracellular multiplication protein IcmM
MGRENWLVLKQNRLFYVNSYRNVLFLLICSVILSTLFIVMIFYIYLRTPEPDYYATNGVTPLVQLKALIASNESSTALLEPDPATVVREKVIPQ